MKKSICKLALDCFSIDSPVSSLTFLDSISPFFLLSTQVDFSDKLYSSDVPPENWSSYYVRLAEQLLILFNMK